MSAEKKQWSVPQFFILARGRPDERVLTHCKAIGVVGGPFVNGQLGCDEPTGTTGKCGNCQARAGS